MHRSPSLLRRLLWRRADRQAAARRARAAAAEAAQRAAFDEAIDRTIAQARALGRLDEPTAAYPTVRPLLTPGQQYRGHGGTR